MKTAASILFIPLCLIGIFQTETGASKLNDSSPTPKPHYSPQTTPYYWQPADVNENYDMSQIIHSIEERIQAYESKMARLDELINRLAKTADNEDLMSAENNRSKRTNVLKTLLDAKNKVAETTSNAWNTSSSFLQGVGRRKKNVVPRNAMGNSSNSEQKSGNTKTLRSSGEDESNLKYLFLMSFPGVVVKRSDANGALGNVTEHEIIVEDQNRSDSHWNETLKGKEKRGLEVKLDDIIWVWNKEKQIWKIKDQFNLTENGAFVAGNGGLD